MTHPSLIFLDLLDRRADARFNIETYTDLPKGAEKPRPDPLVSRFPEQTRGQVEGLIPKLERLNAAGAGVFIAVNEFDGQRSKENLRHPMHTKITVRDIASIAACHLARMRRAR